MRDLRPLLEPRSVAIVGASSSPEKSGYTLLKNIVDGGFPGPIYPINPRAREILGRRACPTIGDVPGPVDLAFIVLPREVVAEAIRACQAKGVGAAVIITAGFREAGGDGPRYQEELAAVIRGGDTRVIGPNTIGMVTMASRLIGTFVPYQHWKDGAVSLMSQTGLFAGALMNELMRAEVQRLGVGKSLPVGNKIDVDEVDFLAYTRRDPATRVIGLHLEGIRDLPGFLRALEATSREKPVVVLKTARTEAGARAAASHTGSDPVSMAPLDAGLGACGAPRARDLEELFAFLKAFAWQPLPRGPRVGVVTWTGAQGVLAVDEIVEAGLRPATFTAETGRRLAGLLPAWQRADVNPVDVWAAAERAARDVTEGTLDAALADPGTDAVLALILAIEGVDFPDVRQIFEGLKARHAGKPLYLVMYGSGVKTRWLRDIEGLEIPVFANSRLAVAALAAAARYAQARGGR
ncbi:MAG TPA: CoA-binding protein [Candidatus Methylomirabilis sp.]|jgi:acetyltransferase